MTWAIKPLNLKGEPSEVKLLNLKGEPSEVKLKIVIVKNLVKPEPVQSSPVISRKEEKIPRGSAVIQNNIQKNLRN